MIVRVEEGSILCITQPDHAALASRLIEAWTVDGLPTRPTRAQVLVATALHDIGWVEEDAAPRLDPDTGGPVDFVAAPTDVRQAIWPRAVRRLAADDAYVGALVAQHALTVYRRHQHDPEWRGFFPPLEQLRDDLYAEALTAAARAGVDAPLSFLQDYSLVGLGDLFSLVFCNGWRAPHAMEGYQAILRDDVLTIAPDPFGGRSIPLEVTARRLAARRYGSETELQAAWVDAAMTTVHGLARGAAPAPPS